MEPPGGLPSDRDKQLVLRTEHTPQQQQQQRQLVPVQQGKPILALHLPQQQPQQALTSIATSPAAAALIAASASSNKHASPAASSNTSTIASTTTPALAATATVYSAATQAATAFSGSSVAHQHIHHHHHHQPPPPPQQQTHHYHHHAPLQQNPSSASSTLLGGLSSSSGGSGSQQTLEKLSRPMAFDKMESLVREMQDPEHGVPVRQQKMFLTSIPYAFMGYDLIEWLMDRLLIEESEALNIANQLCLHGYFFPVNDSKTLTVKDDSSLYRFQTPYYWPWQHKAPDNVEYAIYLAKRSLRNKQRHALEDYEVDALASLHKNLKGKWDFISMQAEEQVRLAKERKKGDKIVGDSQERAYWRVHRPPPGQFTPLEPCPIPSRDRQGAKPNKKRTVDDVQREVDYLSKSLNRTRMKMSQACESLVTYSETFVEYDFFLQPVLPSNPWVTEDVTFWQLNNTFVDIPTEKRVKRWAISIEELVCDPTGLQEFTSFLEKEYSHENIRFWIAVNRLRRSAHSQVARKVNDIYEEFLKPGAPCEINIDGKTMESVLKGLKNPSRFTFDSASEHIYMLLLKKDCYPRFIRSDHYKRLLETGIQPSHKKRFFNFGGVSGAKKKMTAALSSQANLGDTASSKGAGNTGMMQAPPPGSLARRRGSDRSLTGSAHELAVIGVNKEATAKVPHSHSQSNLSEIPYSSESIYQGDMPQRHMVAMDAGIYAAYGNREGSLLAHQETPKPKAARLETTVEFASSAVCPWDTPDEPPSIQAPVPTQVKLSICPWEQDNETSPVTAVTAVAAKNSSQRLTSTSSDISDVSDRMQRNLGIRHQNTVDSGEAGVKRLIPSFTEQRRASVSFTPSRLSESQQIGRLSSSTKTSTTPSPTVGSQNAVDTTFPPLFTPLQGVSIAGAITTTITASRGSGVITKDPPSSSDAELEDELNRLSISQRNSESSTSELPVLPSTTPTPTPPPITKITPPPPDDIVVSAQTQTGEEHAGESSQTESVCAAEGTNSSGATSETEVEPNVQEVKIELVEAAEYEDGESEQKLLEMITLTIEVQQPHDCESAAKLASPKSPKKAAAELEGEPAQLESGTESQKTPSTARSAATSPDKELGAAAACTLATFNPAMVPPSPPKIGPMEEEAQLQQQQQQQEQELHEQLQQNEEEEEEECYAAQEELSPTTDEYQEGLQFGADSKDEYDYDIVDTDSQSGYIPPASTPAPSMAPLAELDVDTVDDEFCEEIKPAVTIPTTSAPIETHANAAEDVKKRRKKRNSDGKKMASLEEKDKASTSTESVGGGVAKTDADHNAVCPWEDENVSTSDGTFVKTYATLGYL